MKVDPKERFETIRCSILLPKNPINPLNSRLVGAISDIPAVHPGELPLFIYGPWTAYVEKLLYSSMIPGQLM